ncbi:MAG: CBS domain-containing protein [Thermoproteota archaeon]
MSARVADAPVENYMSSPVIAVKPDDTVAHARRLMLRHRIGRLVVVDDDERPVGVLTKADLARLASTELARRSLEHVPVEEVMTPNPVTVRVDESVRVAAQRMLEKGVSGLPVVDESGRVVGIVTKTDLTRVRAEGPLGVHSVGSYMYGDPPTVSPQHSVSYVLELLESHPSRRVLVVDAGSLVGIVAPSDIAFLEALGLAATPRSDKRARRFAELPKGKVGPVYTYFILTAGDVMTPEPVTVKPDEDVAAAARLMLRMGVSSLPVLMDGEVLGILTKHGVLKSLLDL